VSVTIERSGLIHAPIFGWFHEQPGMAPVAGE
jgi:hypothetical protein